MSTEETRQERFGRLAFAYCKIATVSLICGRFALPVAGTLSALLFIAGWVGGKKDTKCYLRYPLGAAAFWLVIVGIWFACEFAVDTVPFWLRWVHSR